MDPRLQNAFDAMYAKCEGFMPASRAKECAGAIRQGRIAFAIGEVADGLVNYEPTPWSAPRHNKAIAAFGEFWSVFTALRKEGK